MPFFRPETGRANSKRNGQLVLTPPILIRYSEHLKNKTVVPGQPMRKGMGSKIIIFVKGQSKAGKLWSVKKNKNKKSKAKYKANFCLVCIFLNFRIKDSTQVCLWNSFCRSSLEDQHRSLREQVSNLPESLLIWFYLTLKGLL